MVSQVAQCQCRRCKNCRFNPWVRKISWRRKWQPIPVPLPGEANGWRSLAGYHPRGRKESDTTERTDTHTHTEGKYAQKQRKEGEKNHAIDFKNWLQRKTSKVLVTRKGDLKAWIPVMFLLSDD